MYFCGMKKTAIFLIFIFSLSFLSGQNINSDEESIRNLKQGVDFSIAGGVFFSNFYTAAYYNGSATNENNLNYIFNNYSWKQSIDNLITSNNHFISGSDPQIKLAELPKKMRYSPGFFIQLGVKYRFNESWGISLNYSFARLKAADVFSVTFNKTVPGNDTPDYLLYDIVGIENRSFFDLNAIYLFKTKSIVEPFIELGGQFNFVRVKSFNAYIEGQKFSLLDIYGGSTYVANTNMQTFDTKYGGAGFGVSSAVGIKLAFNPIISIDPTCYVTAAKYGLKGYKDFTFNYGFMIRIVVNDSFFAK
jgi:hypothetical protein